MPPVLPHITLETGPAPRHSIIWLHGLGADGSDFVPLAEEMPLPVAVRYLFPHAPKRPVTINGGFVMRAWYDIATTDIGGTQDAEGIRASQLGIEQLIAQERARGIAAGNIFIAGFSQGGAVTLHTGLRHNERLGGLLALSTYLPMAETLPAEASAANRDIPVFMAHGRSDPVVPHALGVSSRDYLQQHGYRPAWHEYAMPHSVCQEEIADIADWLSQRLRATPA